MNSCTPGTRAVPPEAVVSLNRIVFLLLVALGVVSGTLLSAPIPSTREELSTALLRAEADPTSEFMIRIWRTGDGLPVNDIHELKETSDGYLWLGTYQGLARFDGVRFQTFFTTPTGLRYGTRVGPLEIDGQGRLWVAPDQAGMACLDASGFTDVLTNGAVMQSRAVSLCSDGGTGMMWVDANGGMGRIEIDQRSQVERIKGEASSASRWMRDVTGKLWLVSPRSLKTFQNGKWRDIVVPGNAHMMATPRRAGGMWIAREAKLRYVTADGTTREVATFPWIGQSRVNCLLEDHHQRLWIGTVDQGLFCYSSGQFKQVVPTSSSISCLLEDNDDNIWAGTRGRGLIRLRQRQFFMHDLRSGLANDFVRSISQDQKGGIWLLTAEGGLGCWRNGVWHNLGQEEGWPGYDSLCVLPTNDGSVWVSTVRRGLWRSFNGQFNKRELGPKAPREPIMDLLEDRQGRLWMVTDNSGVFCLEGNKLTGYSTGEGLPSGLIRRIVEDEAGDLWAGDWQGGIARLKDRRWELARKQSGHQDAVRCMVASEGALWIGTSAGGLLRLKEGKTARISMEQGLPDACIQQLLLDGRGSLWGSTPHRLFRIPLQQLNKVADGHQQQVEAITYGRSDGLPDVSFAAWCDPRCWRTTDGELWFATANGAIHCQPSNLQESKPPQVLVEQTLLDGKPVLTAELQRLRLRPERLEFRFTAPCLTAPERVRFRYQMTGWDTDWVDAGTTRSAAYTSLPAGEHVFRVMASSPEGHWSLQTASVGLAVHPYFWQTNWFLVAIAAATAGSGVWIVRRATVRRLSLRVERLRQQRAVDQERARIAQDIHDELGANLTSIGLLADMGTRHKANPVAVSRELGQISQTARESVAAMDAIVWALNPRNDSLDHFANYVSQFTRDFFRPTQLRTRLELPTDLPKQPMATETRHQLFLLVKESFNNIVRHAQATEVQLGLTCENGRLHLTIADNGRGLSSEPKGEGQDGLANLRERIERLGGTLRIDSEPGRGTKLEFMLPLTKHIPD
jgi:signal transduction histidine kinase/ligand-binding sensor domain-containing protein